ncbi:hypothetical protein ABZP36_001250 [Zizania latifolia]
MDMYGRGGYGGIATPGYAPAVPYGMSQVNIEGNGVGRPLPPQPTVKVYCRANPNYAMTIRSGAVVLAPANPKDEYQHWIKDMRWSTSVKDEEGYPAFALVNKATGQAIKHSLGQSHPVKLVPYNPEVLDESVLWTESRDMMMDGYLPCTSHRSPLTATTQQRSVVVYMYRS